MSLNSKTLKFVMAAALVFHTLWVVNHLRWVATEQVDPWKLGGYGMYTGPPPKVRLALFDFSNPAVPQRIDPGTYSLAGYRAMSKYTNISRVFRCAHVTSKELKVLFEENPHFRGNNLGLLYLESKFIHNPVSIKRVKQGSVLITWIGKDFFEFTSEFCGSKKTGKVALL